VVYLGLGVLQFVRHDIKTMVKRYFVRYKVTAMFKPRRDITCNTYGSGIAPSIAVHITASAN
jgi:hypothetical protein